MAIEIFGWVDTVSFAVARTERPWELDIDALVLSVGGGLGSLGDAVREQFPHAPWTEIRFDDITPERPVTMPLTGARKRSEGHLLAVLATPHAENGELAEEPIQVATREAIRAAVGAGARRIGVPLLGTGVLMMPATDVAPVAVAGARDATASDPTGNLEQVVFLCRNEVMADSIRSAWAGLPQTADADPPRVPQQRLAGRDETGPVPLAGGLSSDRVDPTVSIPLSRDQIGVAPYASMLAAVIADRNTEMPLSIGIFGEWGCGKSYFMGLLRGQVEEFARQDATRYCGDIVHIGFNAWHYADSNLWASLGDEIFRQLAGPELTGEQRRERLRAELAERLGQRRELEAATARARTTAATLQSDVDAAVARREISARRLLTALRGSDKVRRYLDGLWRQLGVADDLEQGRLLAEQLHGTLTEADALRRAPRDRAGRLAVALSTVLVVACGLVALMLPQARAWLVGTGAVAATVASTGLVLIGRARSGLRALRVLADDLRSGYRQAAPEIADQLAALASAEADQRVAEAQLAEVLSQAGSLGRQLTELDPGRRLYAFLAERTGGDAYTSKLGLISTIRKDFEQLVALMADWRQHPGNQQHQPIERIVLYIDDLDRCRPHQVVEVLEAVHLLLALDLFVVVVGVDPRWLLRSLSSHYAEILRDDNVLPEDYLEKIFNIPVTLPGMPAGSLGGLLRGMAHDVESATTTTPAPGTDPSSLREPVPPPPFDPAAIPIEKGSEVDTLPDWPQPVPRPLTEPELDLLTALDTLIDTPREAKRLFNLYRMLRATRDLSEASRFLGEDGQPGEYQAVIVLLGLLTAHAKLLGKVLDNPPSADAAGGLMHRPADTRWLDFVADLEPVHSPDGWNNRIASELPDEEIRHWQRLHHGLAQVSAKLRLTDLARCQRWAPRIRRFSYTHTT